MVSLLRSGHENLNWMLLGPKADWLGRRGTVSAAKQLLEPTAGDGGLFLKDVRVYGVSLESRDFDVEMAWN